MLYILESFRFFTAIFRCCCLRYKEIVDFNFFYIESLCACFSLTLKFIDPQVAEKCLRNFFVNNLIQVLIVIFDRNLMRALKSIIR